jgi:adenylate cyclase
VHAAIAGRIDRLAEREKEILRTAAVIGKEFSEPVLRRVSARPGTDLAAALQALVTAEFLYATAVHPEPAFAFKHPLTQEVAYHSQLGDQRSRVHAAVAVALQELRADQLGEHASLIAHHCQAAGMRSEAYRWRRRAALRVSNIRVGGVRRSRDM